MCQWLFCMIFVFFSFMITEDCLRNRLKPGQDLAFDKILIFFWKPKQHIWIITCQDTISKAKSKSLKNLWKNNEFHFCSFFGVEFILLIWLLLWVSETEQKNDGWEKGRNKVSSHPANRKWKAAKMWQQVKRTSQMVM